MAEIKLTVARLTEILRRQQTPAFGPGYEPAIRATREEAPSGSRFAPVWSNRLGRDVHTISTPERKVLSILLYCPWLIELQEQRMLPFAPAAHPLEGYPLAVSDDLKRFQGTLAVAASLHHLSFHPVVTDVQDGSKRDVPGCWIGDLLAFFQDSSGAFCVNFNVKEDRGEFTVPSYGVTVKTNMSRASARSTARHEVEKQLYADVGIPTVEVATNELPAVLIANLLHLLLWHKRGHALAVDQEQLVIDAFNDGLERGASALDVMTAVSLSHGIGVCDQRTVFHQAIHQRKLRIDLFDSHVFIDKPMVPERRDVLAVFDSWFRRPA